MVDSAGTARRKFTFMIEPGVWILFVLLAYIYTFQFDDPLPVYDWGPAHWPRVILFCMFAASLRLLYRDWRMSRALAQSSDQTADEDDQLDTSTKVKVALIFVLPVLYTFLIHRMGFLLITPFFLCGYMWLMGVRRIRTLIILTVCFYSAILLVFVKLIFTYLPPGAGVFNSLNGMILGLLM